MKVVVSEVWCTGGHLVMKCEVWGSKGEWRQKRYASIPLDQIPEEVITDLVGHYLDAQPEEDHAQTALF